MIGLSTLALAAVTVLLCGGKLVNIAKTPFRFLPFIFFGAVIAPLLRFLPMPDLLSYFLTVFKYALLMAAMLANRQYTPLTYLALPGTALNALVILLNNGRMPVHLPDSIAQAGGGSIAKLASGQLPGYILETKATLLPFLGDVIHLYAFGQWVFISIGDILLVLGAFVFVIRAVKGDYAVPELNEKNWGKGFGKRKSESLGE